jgi:hypothetical protein
MADQNDAYIPSEAAADLLPRVLYRKGVPVPGRSGGSCA